MLYKMMHTLACGSFASGAVEKRGGFSGDSHLWGLSLRPPFVLPSRSLHSKKKQLLATYAVLLSTLHTRDFLSTSVTALCHMV
jgi:hypothetical protein